MAVSDYALDPELAPILEAMIQAANGPLLDFSDVPALRARLRAAETPADAHSNAQNLADPRVNVETVQIARDDGSLLDIVLFRPSDQPDSSDASGPSGRQAEDRPKPALLWFHAGGQVLGSAHEDAPYHASLALALDCVLAAVDYRLAPETEAPGAAEDGYLAYTYLREHATHLGIAPDRIGLAGASGGGAPAAAIALMARDRHYPAPCLLALSYPMLDDRNETQSSHEILDLGIVDRDQNLHAWSAVLGDRAGAPDLHPYCAPARATDLADLPPTFVAAAQFDVFRDENVDFARKLIAAGVPVDLHVYAGAFHAWDRFAPKAALTASFEQTWHTFLRRRLHG
ncbi:alpha/beta hydrolase fold domain-containing protein [Streptomyces luomodiensis]|uniref:Alpha/beta hydrolase fold domain-containing protein n=1 Tax=Streptomyces luomodiensis TaxID=3026192 RepID=A0ABY9UX26_9ACTN|nr:alpha/beta hydrolase fold domain-containing protein [Streptomyces sp. SCA4-21]WNE97114.1 alpha/beta hydrolase fold domain-containing protein [Streptomyces sp. SCA4-21]